MVKTKEILLFVALITLGLFSLYIYNYIKEAKKEIFTKIEKNKIQNISYMLNNIKENILYSNNINNSNDLVSLLSNKKSRLKYEKHLTLLTTPSMKYIYLLTKDKKDRFRFLLDGSRTDKANFYQKFDVTNEEYKTIYKTKKPQVIRQINMGNLFLTYLYPVVKNDKIIAILSVDITTKIKKTVLELIQPLETFFIVLIIFVLLLIVMTIIQVFHYFITRKKIFVDPLTQVYNRNYLLEISPLLNLNKYSIAMLDLDRFKLINDTYGHKTGDYILSKSSQIFKNSIRDSDILIRYGGEEFLLFINKRGTDDKGDKICERVRENINAYIFSHDNHEIRMQVSIGVHENPSMEKNLQEAIKVADKMLYIAKSQGRNRTICYNEKSKNITLSKSKNINFVKEALEEGRVTCYYQPIYNHHNNTILKYEALVRIVDKKNNIVSPGFFLPEIKHTNIHYKLTQRILSIIFEKFKDNSKSVSININFSDLINADIEKTIMDTCKSNPDLATRITFEILESDEIDNIPLFKEKIKLLHSLGAKVSIDDFGSGYSNFKTILDIETNFLKIDGSLVKNIDKNEKDFKVVKSIIHFAKEADIQTIAEFVHSKEIYEKLSKLNLDYMQGYYISQPLEKLIDENDLFKE